MPSQRLRRRARALREHARARPSTRSPAGVVQARAHQGLGRGDRAGRAAQHLSRASRRAPRPARRVRVHLVHQARCAQRLAPRPACRRSPRAGAPAGPDALDEERRDLRRHDAQGRLRQPHCAPCPRQRDVDDAGQAEAAAHHRALEHARSTAMPVRAKAPHRSPKRALTAAIASGSPASCALARLPPCPSGRRRRRSGRRRRAARSRARRRRPRPRQRRAQLADHLQRHRVAHLGPVQRHVQHAAAAERRSRASAKPAINGFPWAACLRACR